MSADAQLLVEFLRGFPPTRHINFVVGPVAGGRRFGIGFLPGQSQEQVNQAVGDAMLLDHNREMLENMATKPIVYVTITESEQACHVQLSYD